MLNALCFKESTHYLLFIHTLSSSKHCFTRGIFDVQGAFGGFFFHFCTLPPAIFQFSSVQFSCSVTSDSLRPHELQHARPPCPSPTPGVHSNSIESVMPSSHLILCRPLLLLPRIPPSIRVFSNESTLRMRWPKYWSFSFSIILSKEHPELISFRMHWLDLLAVQGTLKSLPHYHKFNIFK